MKGLVDRLLSRGRAWLQERGLLDPTEPLPPLEEQVRALLDDLSERSAEAARGEKRGTLVRGPDRALYVASVLAVFEELRNEGREEASEALLERVGWECCCRCLAHRKIGCPKCLNVYGCPVHSEVGPELLRPDVLRDPEQLAREVHATYLDQLELPEGTPEPPSWTETTPEFRKAFEEAVRRVVCARVAQGGGTDAPSSGD